MAGVNDQFRACVREVFHLDVETNVWLGRWDVSGTLPSGERRQLSHESPVENVNAPLGEREAAVRELHAKAKHSGLIPSIGVLELPKRNKHLSRYLA